MDKEKVKGKISDAIEITKDITDPSLRNTAFEVVLTRLMGEETSLAVWQKQGETSNLAAGKQASEFLASLHLKSQLEQLEAITYYFLKSGQEGATRAEVLETLSKARLSRPKNISDVVGRCIRRGHIIEGTRTKDNQKILEITPTGEKYIEEKIKPEAKA